MITREELIQKWLEALRSGKYRQGKGYLKSQDEQGVMFDAIGVLCDVAGVILIPVEGQSFYKDVDGFVSIMPVHVHRILQLSDRQEWSIMWQNDNGWDFHEIADWIELILKGDNYDNNG